MPSNSVQSLRDPLLKYLSLQASRFPLTHFKMPHKYRSRPPISSRSHRNQTSVSQYSTAHESQLWDREPMPPSMLYDRKPKGSSGPTTEYVNNTNVHDRKAAINSRQKSSGRQATSPSNRGKPPHRMSMTGKRKADSSLDGPPANRRRTDLKDERFIHRTMALPTKAEYHYLPPNIFANPKATLHNAVQGRAQLTSIFSPISGSHSRCTLSCTISSQEPLVIVGEGDSKVG